MTLSTLARHESLFVAAIGAGGAILVFAVAVGIQWLTIAGALVTALGAVGELVFAVKRHSLQDEEEEYEATGRLRVPPAAVRDVDATQIGVDPAEQSILPGAGFPEYVPRTADEELRRAVRAAVDGSGDWLVVVLGPAKVGKSRSLFQALRDCPQTAALDLIAPVKGALEWLLKPGEAPRYGEEGAVLWLDDVEPFLDHGVTWQTLRGWHEGGPRRIVAATSGGKGNDLVADSKRSGLAVSANDVLQHARRITLRGTTVEEVRPLLSRLGAGEASSLERHGLAAYVVAGPRLEDKLATGVHHPGDDPCPEGVALVHAAVDWARCGRTDPIPHESLRALWPSYRSHHGPPTDELFERALAWALLPVAGTIALLQHTTGYQAFNYVVRLVSDQGGAARHECWELAVASATDAQAFAVGASAYLAGRKDVAEVALERARDSSVDEIAATAAYNLGVVLIETGRMEEAVVVFDQIETRFGHRVEPALLVPVASALANKGAALAELREYERAIVVCDEVAARFGDRTEPAVVEQVARALFNKSHALAKLNQHAQVIVVCDEVSARFGHRTEPAVLEQVAKALCKKGAALEELDRREEAIAVYDQIAMRFAGHTDPALVRIVEVARKARADIGEPS